MISQIDESLSLRMLSHTVYLISRSTSSFCRHKCRHTTVCYSVNGANLPIVWRLLFKMSKSSPGYVLAILNIYPSSNEGVLV
jgi:hypothetical protein